MLKYSLVFAGGMVTTAIIAYEGHASAGAWFVIGILATVIVQAAFLLNPARAARFARFLSAFVAAWSGKPAGRGERSKVVAIDAEAALAPAAPGDDDEDDDQAAILAADVASALVNLSGRKPTKADRQRAEKIAREAVEQLPAGDFDEVFRLALTTLRSYAKAA